MENKTVIKSYKDLIVWQKSMDLVVLVYKLTQIYPKEEQFGLTSQTRRSSVSIPSNIAEARKRSPKREYYHRLSIAYGSGCELETQLEIGARLGFGDEILRAKAISILEEVMKMLNKILTTLNSGGDF